MKIIITLITTVVIVVLGYFTFTQFYPNQTIGNKIQKNELKYDDISEGRVAPSGLISVGEYYQKKINNQIRNDSVEIYLPESKFKGWYILDLSFMGAKQMLVPSPTAVISFADYSNSYSVQIQSSKYLISIFLSKSVNRIDDTEKFISEIKSTGGDSVFVEDFTVNNMPVIVFKASNLMLLGTAFMPTTNIGVVVTGLGVELNKNTEQEYLDIIKHITYSIE